MGSPTEITSCIDALVSRVHALRNAGVTKLQIGDIVAEFLPIVEPAKDTADSRQITFYNESRDPLNDPATYADGRVPSLDYGGEI